MQVRIKCELVVEKKGVVIVHELREEPQRPDLDRCDRFHLPKTGGFHDLASVAAELPPWVTRRFQAEIDEAIRAVNAAD